jgi:hypothetical protein
MVNQRAFNGTLEAMVDQHRKKTGRGESKSELERMKAKLYPIARDADRKIEQTKREKGL